MKEWIAIGVSVVTLLVLLIGGVWYAGHQDQKFTTVVTDVQEQSTTLDRIDRNVAWLYGHLGEQINPDGDYTSMIGDP